MLVMDLNKVNRESAIKRLGLQIVKQTESGLSGHEVPFYDDQLIWVSSSAMQDYQSSQDCD